MADFITHTLFGESILPFLPSGATRMTAKYPAAFRWGLQGPDLLFFRKAILGSSPLYRYASLMHREKTSELFHAMTEYLLALDDTDQEIVASYFYGFLCHYALDSEIHPYVYYKQEEWLKKSPKMHPSAAHCQIETDIDSAYYTMLKKEPVTTFSPSKVYEISELEKQLIAKFYVFILQTVYQSDVDFYEVLACFKDTLMIQDILYQKTRTAYYLAKGLEMVTGRKGLLSSHMKAFDPKWDCLNLHHKTWCNLTSPQQKRSDSVPEILKKAQTKALDLSKLYAHQIQNRQAQPILFSQHFDNGNIRHH